MARAFLETKLGILVLEASDLGLTKVQYTPNYGAVIDTTHPHLKLAMKELQAYLQGDLKIFTTPLDLSFGTPFQQKVWKQLCKIPYGYTTTYAQEAISIGAPTYTRAVANANAQNDIMIIVPCHRVVGQSGKLTGYRGGIEIKRQLLALENYVITQEN